jgi:ParB-like chromosome segregation protein Spo0J
MSALWVRMPLAKVKSNPSNPRIIKDDKFRKLVQSIRDFPEMLELRPIVVDADGVVLGGNMRLRAAKEAGLTEVPVIRADHLTAAQQREFVVKDNVGFGEWDWDALANDWDEVQLRHWGIDAAITASFTPTSADDQGKLDKKLPESCPHCGGLLP